MHNGPLGHHGLHALCPVDLELKQGEDLVLILRMEKLQFLVAVLICV